MAVLPHQRSWFMDEWEENAALFTKDYLKYYLKKETLHSLKLSTGYKLKYPFHYWNHVYCLCMVQEVLIKMLQQLKMI